RPRRRRAAECCFCCSLWWGITWKALGVICLLFIAWRMLTIVLWTTKPAFIAMENMPEFSTSLRCEDASHIYNPDQPTYTIPVNSRSLSHFLELHGGAVGTLILANGLPEAADIELDLTLRTNDQSLLEDVTFQHPTQDEVDQRLTKSYARLTTPMPGQTSCMRYDMVLRIPPQLRSLDIQSQSIAQVQFAPDVELDLDSLSITLNATSNRNMLLPTAAVRAKRLTLSMLKGWLVGEASIVHRTVVDTKGGDAVTRLGLFPAPDPLYDEPSAAVLKTYTGAGRSEFFYVLDRTSSERTISSKHVAPGKGDLHLTYREAAFSGKLQLRAQSHTLTGNLHQPTENPDGSLTAWVGDGDGEDEMSIRTQGWVGLRL
ncbi:hypothetical protein BDW22DRAFT_1327074, partial [Trametopsis cervina]